MLTKVQSAMSGGESQHSQTKAIHESYRFFQNKLKVDLQGLLDERSNDVLAQL